MAAFEMNEVLQATGGTLVATHTGPRKFLRIQTDSRKVKRGDLFLALKGLKFDGHDFIERACQRGARGILVEEEKIREVLAMVGKSHSIVPVVIGVQGTLRAYQDLAMFHRTRFTIPIIAITGSNGKTTTKEMVSRVLATQWRVHKTPKNFNNAIGVPQTLLEMGPSHNAAVIEMGVDQVGQTTRLCEITRPTVGVITNVGPDHLETYGTVRRSAISKAEMLPHLPKDGNALLNVDDSYFRMFSQKARCSVMSYGFSDQADVQGKDIRWNGWRSEFRLVLPTLKTAKRAVVRTVGRHNISNALAGAAVGCALGLSSKAIISGLADFKTVPMRSEIRRWGRVVYLYDCYNANPASVKAALDLLVSADPTRRTIAVLSDMLELGQKGMLLHREIGMYAAKKQVNHVIACGGFGEVIKEGVRKIRGRTEVTVVKNAMEAGHVLKALVRQNDIVLIKASRGEKMERVWDIIRQEK